MRSCKDIMELFLHMVKQELENHSRYKVNGHILHRKHIFTEFSFEYLY